MIETKEEAQKIARELIELINTPDTDKDLYINVQVVKSKFFKWSVIITPTDSNHHIPLACRVFGYVNKSMYIWSIVSYDREKDIVYIELY